MDQDEVPQVLGAHLALKSNHRVLREVQLGTGMRRARDFEQRVERNRARFTLIETVVHMLGAESQQVLTAQGLPP